MFLNQKLVIVGLALVVLAPLAAQADSSSLFATPQRVVRGQLVNNINLGSVDQRAIVQGNPCLSEASRQLVSDIENSSAYDQALNNYNNRCSNSSASAPSFTIYADYEFVPPITSGMYSLGAAIVVNVGKTRRLVWTTDPNHSPTNNNNYVARVGASDPSCPSISQWEQRANVNAVQALIVRELNNDAQSCNSGKSSDGVGDGLGSQARSRSRSNSNSSDPNAVSGASWAVSGSLR